MEELLRGEDSFAPNRAGVDAFLLGGIRPEGTNSEASGLKLGFGLRLGPGRASEANRFSLVSIRRLLDREDGSAAAVGIGPSWSRCGEGGLAVVWPMRPACRVMVVVVRGGVFASISPVDVFLLNLV